MNYLQPGQRIFGNITSLNSLPFSIVFLIPFFLFSGLTPCYAQSIIPKEALAGELAENLHPHSHIINAFLVGQKAHNPDSFATGLTRADYLPVIASIVKGIAVYQNAKGQIIDPVIGREHQYSTPCFAHAVAVLFKSGYADDAELLRKGIAAMEASLLHMLNDKVPDSHGDFFTLPMMMAFEAFRGVVPEDDHSRWRADLGKIEPSKVYINAAPNWIGINVSGEFLRFKEGLTPVQYVQERLEYQVTRMGLGGLYQDSYKPETDRAKNSDGQSFAYDNVARAVLGIIAHNGYEGDFKNELRLALWKGAWTGLLNQSPFGEVPTGMRSSHHFWNEAYAALNYEIYASHYANAGKLQIAGAFKRAAKLSLAAVKKWLRPDGSGFVTKARYPKESRWGYMKYSGHAQYNMWCAHGLGMAWQYADSTVKEMPAPCDIGGYVLPVIPGFKKIFANVGGNYVEYDVRGDHSHNPTGLIRVHLKNSSPQLGPSDGAVGQFDPGDQYHPLYPTPNSPHEQNLSIGPAWEITPGKWRPLAELIQLPKYAILEQSLDRCAFRVSYIIGPGAAIHQTIAVEKGGVTVRDSLEGFDKGGLRVYYPMLVTDGEDKTGININGNQVILQLKGKGIRFSILKPTGQKLQRTRLERNHRNGRCEAVYSDIPGRIAEYSLTPWPAQSQTAVENIHDKEPMDKKQFLIWRRQGVYLPKQVMGTYRFEIYSLQGKALGKTTGNANFPGPHFHPLPLNASGCFKVVITWKNQSREFVLFKL